MEIYIIYNKHLRTLSSLTFSCGGGGGSCNVPFELRRIGLLLKVATVARFMYTRMELRRMWLLQRINVAGWA